MLKKWAVLVSGIMLAGWMAAPSMAEEPAIGEGTEVGPAVDEIPAEWIFSLRPYFFLSGLTGLVTVSPVTIPLNSSFSDLLNHVKLGGFLNFTAEKGQWGTSGDFQYINLYGTGSGAVDVALDLKNVIGEVDVFYRPVRSPSLRFLAGVRIYSLTQTFTLERLDIPSVSATMVDPVIGAYGAWELSDRWDFELRGDIGGFGVSSEFTYQVMGLFHWDISNTLAIPFGYRVLGYNIMQGDVQMDTRMSGMMLGLDIRF